MPLMTRIPSDLARFGLKVELAAGWATRGSASFAPAGVTCHWTAGPRGTTGRPSLGVVTNGRTGLAGPLCNVYLARDGVCVVVAAGRANHAGEGGYKGLVGNSSVYGIEAESGGDGDWTDAQRVAYPKLVAALLSGLGRSASWAMGHNEWAPTRKIDIRDWPMSAMRTQVALELLTPNPTPTPEKETDLMAAIKVAVEFVRDPQTGAVWECSVLNGTRVHLTTPIAVTDRKHRLTQAGVPWVDKKDIGESSRLDAFGVDLVARVADEIQRRESAK